MTVNSEQGCQQLPLLPPPGSTERVAEISQRLSRLRDYLKLQGLDACIIPSSDPHQSEYLAECWKFREYLSGFSGSFGTLVVANDAAGFWTDSRYFLQAEKELEETGITLFRLAVPGTPALEAWIASQGYKQVGLDGSQFATNEVLRLIRYFADRGVRLNADCHPYTMVWPDRPAMPQVPIQVFPEHISGETVSEKLARIRKALTDANADSLTVTTLDDLAWLFNIRGMDVDFNPVVMAFAYVDLQRCLLFVESTKLTEATREHLTGYGVELAGYNDFVPFMGRQKGVRLLFDKARSNYELYSKLDDSCTIIEGLTPIAQLKACKNQVELAGYKEANLKDGVALVKLFRWLEEETRPGKTTPYPTEWSIAEKAAAFRREQGDYVCESFAPIVSFKDHGAVVHYEATPESSYTVEGEGVLLLDLGAHYLHGSTDTTRTLYLNGQPFDLFKADYTTLLKGVMALTNVTFPEGTRGTQLDIMARQFIWQRRINYLHGTGHGVGHCLFVHEGPQSIRMNENPVTIEPGMVMSNEPAIYRTGSWGVRVENVIHCYELEPSSYGRFFGFETLTRVPLERNCIETSLLSPDERAWIDAYHQQVYTDLAPRLTPEECDWLKAKTRPLD